MELRTRAEQRELDTGRVTLREAGRELQNFGNQMRLEHIDRSKTINIRKQAMSGAQKTLKEGGTNAESSSPDIAYVLRTLPPDLRKHWDSLTETRQREIIEKASASAERKGSGGMEDAPVREKNLVRRYGNAKQTVRENTSRKQEEEAGSYTVSGKTPDRPISRNRRNDPIRTGKKQGTITRESAQENAFENASIKKKNIIASELKEASGTQVHIRQRSMQSVQPERPENAVRSSQASSGKSGNQPSGISNDRSLPESGYEKRLAGRRGRTRNRSYVKEQTPEIRNRQGSGFRTNENGIGSRTKEGPVSRNTTWSVGKEYGKRQSLKKLKRGFEETTELRVIDNRVEDGTELRATDQKSAAGSGLRTARQESGNSSGLRLTGQKPETENGGLRTIQTDRFQMSVSEQALEKDHLPGSIKDNGRQTKEAGGKAAGIQRGKTQSAKPVSQNKRPEDTGGQIKGRGDSKKQKEKAEQRSSGSGAGIDAKLNRSGAASTEMAQGDTISTQRMWQDASGTRRKRRITNDPETAAPSQGNKNSAVRLIRRKRKEDGAGHTSRYFVTSFTNLVKADYDRVGQITQEKKRAQVESSLQEYQDATAARAVRIAVTPLRIAAKKAARAAVKKIVTAIVSATTAVINMLLPALVLLLPVLLIAAILPGLMGSLVAEEEEGAGYNVSGGSIVEYARQWIGKTKYIYGAGRNGPLDWQDYADCSSFVHGVFSHFGVEIGWTTVEQENSGSKVCENTLSKAEPGDIVLFYDGGSIRSGGSGHVGIYSGNGNMVHNSSSRGTVVEAPVSYQNRPYVVRRITVPFSEDRTGGGGNATGGHRKDPTNYSQSQLELIWAIVAQEDNGSYKGALAVISSAMNRTESSKWGYCGRTAMEQLTAPGQYCYSNDTYWMARLGGNVPDYVKTAVNDCLKKGIRNHNHTSFRSTKGKVTGPDAVQIGGNWFFDY